VALVGPNGAGKTTLLRHLNGLSRPASGRVMLRGEDIRRRRTSALARDIGMAFQNPESQFFCMSVREEIAAGPLALGCLDPSWIAHLTELFGLQGCLDRAPYRLSGGEKRRVAFASALAANPSVLALDEPTAGQDLFFRERLSGLLSALRQQGRGVLFATHDLPFAAACADRWVVLAEGRAAVQGPPSRVLSDPAALRLLGVEPGEVGELLGAPGEG
jgi:energy-coupling factor transporter ATP-binding protein EcfA2